MTAARMSREGEFASANPVQRDTRPACAGCGGPVVRKPRARGPRPSRCATCRAAVRRVCQLRAYLRSAKRIAIENGMRELEDAIGRAVSVVDREVEL
jgi:hypothetical protein